MPVTFNFKLAEDSAPQQRHRDIWETCPQHTQRVFDPARLPKVVEWAAARCAAYDIQGLVVCGFSGLLPGAGVSLVTGIPLLAARKVSEEARADSRVACGVLPGGAPIERWAWLDDLISTGGTFRTSVERVYRNAGLVATPVPTIMLLHDDLEDVSDGGALRYTSDSPKLGLAATYPRRTTPGHRIPSFGFLGSEYDV